MSELLNNDSDELLNNYPDAVIMAIHGTNNYEVSYWWLDAISVVAGNLHPHIEAEIKDIINYLEGAIHADDPNIHQKMWDKQIIKYPFY